VWFELSDFKIVWNTDFAPKPIHPSVDVVRDKFYFGLLLPVEGESITYALCFINDEKDCFIVTDEELSSRKLYLKYPAVLTQLKWDIEDIKKFIEYKKYIDHTTILNDIEKELQKYLEFPDDEREYTLISLWILGTYLQPVWFSYPYIGVSGVKRTGKSKLLKFVEMLAFNALFSTNISTAVLYRLIQSLRCTILMDEAEALSNKQRKSELKNILYSGYKKCGFVYRSSKTAKEKIVPEKFEVFSPKIFVTFEGLEDILTDRSVEIVMIRTDKKEISDREIDENDPIWTKIRNKLYVFALENWKKIRELYRSFDEVKEIHSRELELWKPMLVLAKFFGEDVYEKIKGLAIKKIKEKEMREETETMESLLLSVLVEMVVEDGFYAVVDIQKKIKESFNEDFSTHWIGKALSYRFGFKESKRLSRPGRPTARRLTVSKVLELARRYGVSLKPTEDVYGVIVESEETEASKEKKKICEICGKNPGIIIIREGVEYCICDVCQLSWEGKL